MASVEQTNWLAHRWPIQLEKYQYGQWLIHVGKVEGQKIFQGTSRAEYEQLRAQAKPLCLARFVASRPRAHPAAVLVVAGEYRLGRVPPDLWCGYDVTLLPDLPPLTCLSAKARAMFPDWPAAMLRILPAGQVASLDLRPVPRGPRLRVVA
ncbi:MAG: hypothetical protein EOP58_00120 [Sphingomonadales bacterium]|nr:MAG: hypothetical protein EOP58_00120 [Sphingomonadales bacterium]